MKRENEAKEWQKLVCSYDERRDLAIPGDTAQTLKFCVAHFISIGLEAIADHGYFAVALSGGNTPKAIFQLLSLDPYRTLLPWDKVWLFWSDERCVPKTHTDSNYKMAMDSGLATLPIPPENVFPMETMGNLEENALAYEKLIESKLGGVFDLVMLGMGDDGHTASLFPKTHGLHSTGDRLVIANYIPEKDVWRMTLTFDCINRGNHIAIYVLGENKAKTVKRALNGPYEPDLFPVERVGTPANKALWILDKGAASAVLPKV